MRRREFLGVLGGAAVAWPAVARAQQPAMPVIGFLNSRSPGEASYTVAAFHKGLSESGYVAGRNVVVEYRWAEGNYDLLPGFAADLVRRGVTVIVATGGQNSAIAAKSATLTIPIVFSSGSDPVQSGLVASLNRPGGNLTGVHLFLSGLEPKKLGLIREISPNVPVIGVLLNPSRLDYDLQSNDVKEAARAIGQQIEILKASNRDEIDAAFARMVQIKVGALVVGADPSFNTWREQIVVLAARHLIPAVYELREFAVAGGLMSYGTSLVESYRQVGVYAGRVLKGEKPTDLPVVQVTKFEFVINLRTAKALGLAVPPTMSARADEVIE